eukprot:TRINITY_DN53934_c0_g2_i1.p1 TRINITY_DN53934_c0_g2~~TRINITY_DN53934_c0_g2_i1.p1  ORF type:complete len:191 (-),score=39.27 TRINITY_DN53934_c0_g2_i1:21-593(-)
MGKQIMLEFQKKIRTTLMQLLDSDKDGKLTIPDFMSYLIAPYFSVECKKEVIKEGFNGREYMSEETDPIPLTVLGSFIYADKDGDRLLTYEETLNYMKEFFACKGTPLPPEEKIIEKFKEISSGGKIGFEEFIRFFELKELLLENFDNESQNRPAVKKKKKKKKKKKTREQQQHNKKYRTQQKQLSEILH